LGRACCQPSHSAAILTLLPPLPGLQDCLALGSILAATDSVAALQVIKQERFPLLYSVVFGEGVLNDATSIVILGTIQASQCVGWQHTSCNALQPQLGPEELTFEAGCARCGKSEQIWRLPVGGCCSRPG